MELFTSAWVIFLLYCTEWLGIHQCFALPVPTLTNNYYRYYSKNHGYKESKYPDTKYEKFVFPSKQQEIMPILAERSGFETGSAGKIFFPDEIPEPEKDKQYQYTDDKEVLPVWNTQAHPSSGASSSQRVSSTVDRTKSVQPSKDGSTRIESPTKYQPTDNSQPSDHESNFRNTLHLAVQASKGKPSQQERVRQAVQEYYKWLLLNRPKFQQKESIKCQKPVEAGSSDITSSVDAVSVSSSKPGSVISDQSLVSGLKDQKCPEGQIRLQNGECRVKLDI